jgi:hypothetical protein
MPILEIKIENSPEKLVAFRRNEINCVAKFSISEANGNYWVEALVEVDHPLSLAPDRQLKLGKINVGIFNGSSHKEKRFKIFSNNDIYPDTFSLKVTALIYDEDGAVADRKEIKHEIVCSDENGKILQSK